MRHRQSHDVQVCRQHIAQLYVQHEARESDTELL
jgi:hypothetical protein